MTVPALPDNIQKILIVNIYGIGDVLFTTPFISNLRENFPGVEIGYICNNRTAPLLSTYQKVDKIFIYERDEFQNDFRRSKRVFWTKARDLVNRIRAEEFDVVFDFSLNATSDFLMWQIGIKHRIGLNYRNRSKLLTTKFKFSGFESEHVVDCYLKILTDLGLKVTNRTLEMNIHPDEDTWAETYWNEQGLSGSQPVIGVLPGAGASWGAGARFRRWDGLKYAKLVDKMIENFKARIILMGDKSEVDLCRDISQNRDGEVSEAFGKTSLGQLAALMKRCRLVVLNDGGPLHIAVACGARTVSIFGPVDDHVYGPYGPRDQHFVVKRDMHCRPCYRRFRMANCSHISCLQDLSVDDVLKKVKEAL